MEHHCPILTATQLESYRQQQALQIKLIKDILSKMGDSGSKQPEVQ